MDTSLDYYFEEYISAAVAAVRRGSTAFLFDVRHLKYVLAQIPRVCVELQEGIYVISEFKGGK